MINKTTISNEIKYLNPEEEIILLCSRFELDETQRDRLIFLLKKPLNWKDILKMAHRNRVLTWIYKHIKTDSMNSFVPENIIQEMEKFYSKTLAKNRILFCFLKECLIEFEKAGNSRNNSKRRGISKHSV